jgi:hypothetical protein
MKGKNLKMYKKKYHLIVEKNDKLFGRVSHYIMQLLYDIYIPFQWRPLFYMRIKNVLFLLFMYIKSRAILL